MSVFNPNVHDIEEVRRALQKIKPYIDAIQNHVLDTPTETPNGSQTNFSTEHVYVAGTLKVFVNGAYYKNGVALDEDSDKHGYTFRAGYIPKTGWWIHHEYVKDFEA